MQSKISFKQSVFAVCVVGLICASIIIFDGASTSPAVAQTFVKQESSTGLVRLVIPKIKVDALVDPVGLLPDGSMGAPVGPTTVDWFDLGPRPGDIGSAVIDGHFGWKDGIAAVFDDISQLQKGDKIYIEDNNGTTTFVVQGIKTYGENESASTVFHSSDGLAHLNLITCEGIWNAKNKSYSGRLVVFADKE